MKYYSTNILLDFNYTFQYQKEHSLPQKDLCVRLQWDPDHSPSYEKLERRAIQLGLKGQVS